MKPFLLPILAALSFATPLHADAAQDFVTANIISTLYHAFSHALIEVESPPVLGQEEDAADILSILLLDAFWEEDSAQSIIALTALSFELAAQEAENPAYWDRHGLDIERYYNQVCLFYGANPESRATLAEEFGLPAERAQNCVAELNLGAAAWAASLGPLQIRTPVQSNAFAADTSSDVRMLLTEEIAALNGTYKLPRPVAVTLESCGEENAFYAPETATITICSEYVEFLERQAIANDL